MYVGLILLFGLSLLFTAPVAMYSQSLGPILLIAIEAAGILVCMGLDNKEREELSKQWKLVAEGIFDHVVYGYYNYTTRSGAMVHTTHTHKMDVTVLYFTDGKTSVLKGRRDIDFSNGIRVKVLENGLQERKIEVVTSGH